MAKIKLSYGLAIGMLLLLSSTASVSASGEGAHIFYRRGVTWREPHATLLAAVQVNHPITSMHIIDGKLCSKLPFCSADGLLALGDAIGGVHVVSPTRGSVTSQDSALSSPVTALASLQAGRNTSMLITLAAHADGRISYHCVHQDTDTSSRKEQELKIASLVVFPAFADDFESPGYLAGSREILQLEVSAPIKVAGKFFATVAVLTRDGHVATATLRMLSFSNPSLTWHPSSPNPLQENRRIASIKMAKGSVHIFNEDGTMRRISIRRAGERHVHLPTQTCRGWDTLESSIAAIHDSQIILGVPPVYAITLNGTLVVSKGSNGPGCGVLSSSDLSDTFVVGEGRCGVRLATVPGYLLATTLDAQLVVVNMSGPPRNPELSVVMRGSIHDLAADVPGLEKEEQEAWLFSTFFQRQRQHKKESNHVLSSPPLLATASAYGGLASAPSSNSRVLIQLRPRVAAFYASSLPYFQRPSSSKGAFSWMQILHPFLLAIIIGAAIHRTKTGRQQAALIKTINAGGSSDLPPTYSSKNRLPSELEKRLYGPAVSERRARRRKNANESDDNDIDDGNTLAHLRPQPPIDYAPLIDSVSRLGAGAADEERLRQFVADASGSTAVEESRAVWD